MAASTTTRKRPADAMEDSARSQRAERLHKLVGSKTVYARYPAPQVEFQMDVPPADKDVRAHWKPVIPSFLRVYWTIIRFSWCWPYCWEYAVVGDGDEIMWDAPDMPQPLSEESIAERLGVSRVRVQNLVLDLTEIKLIRAEKVPCGRHGRQRMYALFPEFKSALSLEERRKKSTLSASGVEGPALEGAVKRRFTNLISRLGEDDDATISVSGDDGINQVIRVGDYKVQTWQAVAGIRYDALEKFKEARSEERANYTKISLQVRKALATLPAATNGNGAHPKPAAAPRAPDPPPPPAPPVDPVAQLKSFSRRIREKFAGKGTPATDEQCDRWLATLRASKRDPDVFFAWLTPDTLKKIHSVGAVGKLIENFDRHMSDLEEERRAFEEEQVAEDNRPLHERVKNLRKDFPE